MSPQIIHIYALIALRALADYDFAEFRRSTDMSKGQVDERIDEMLEQLHERTSEQVLELKGKVDELRAIARAAHGQIEPSFLLRQLSSSSLQRAQQLAFTYARSAVPRARMESVRIASLIAGAQLGVDNYPEEFTRLGVMRLLRRLPDYSAIFNQRVRGVELDAHLVPSVESLPDIFVEAKTRLRSPEMTQGAIDQLRHCKRFEGDDSKLVLLTGGINPKAADLLKRTRPKVYVLVYDSEINEFAGDDIQSLVTTIQKGYVNGP